MADIGKRQVKSGSSSKPQFTKQIPEAGIQVARLLHVIDLGKQVNKFVTPKALQEKEDQLRTKSDEAVAKGKKPFSEDFIQGAVEKMRYKHAVKLTFELSNDVLTSGPNAGKPLVISKDVSVVLTGTGSAKQSTLSLVIAAILGRPLKDDEDVDFNSLVGKALQLILVHKPHNGNTYANISGFAPVGKGQVVPELVNDPIVITDAENPDPIMLDKLKNSKMKWVLDEMNIGTGTDPVDF